MCHCHVERNISRLMVRVTPKENQRFLARPGMTVSRRNWPMRGWTGVILVAVCWPLNWLLPGVRTAYLFFPLWLGYVLVVAGLVQGRRGGAIWERVPTDLVLRLLVSAPVWWLFELINLRTANWEYLGRNLFSAVQFN